MSSAARMAGLLAVAALLVYGAAGLSGHLVGEDHCMLTVEGSSGGMLTHWIPPGVECIIEEPSGRVLRSDRTGSWPAFFASLLVGFAVVGLALLRRPRVPARLRLTAVTTLAFAFAGAGAIVGGWQFTVVFMVWFGAPVAAAADLWLRPRDDRRWPAGFTGAVVAGCAAVVASVGYLYGLGAAAYGLTILLVAAFAALPWRRLLPRPVTNG